MRPASLCHAGSELEGQQRLVPPPSPSGLVSWTQPGHASSFGSSERARGVGLRWPHWFGLDVGAVPWARSGENSREELSGSWGFREWRSLWGTHWSSAGEAVYPEASGPQPSSLAHGPWSLAVRTVACAGKEQAGGVCHRVQRSGAAGSPALGRVSQNRVLPSCQLTPL